MLSINVILDLVTLIAISRYTLQITSGSPLEFVIDVKEEPVEAEKIAVNVDAIHSFRTPTLSGFRRSVVLYCMISGYFEVVPCLRVQRLYLGRHRINDM